MSAENRWAAFAAEDAAIAEAARGLGLWNQVCLHAQQAAGKSLKAFLAERHRPIPMARHLAELLALCAEADQNLSRFEDRCYALDKYLIPLTYPDAVPSSQSASLPTEKDALEALGILKELREALRVG
ncbi:MAG: HEPN domain-containing protein [Nitrospirae bacterium]|nr:MAG: HEPN domain-containing protein [Nitrospirota bacterium]